MKRMKNVIYLWMIHWEWRLVRSYVNSWDWVLRPDKEKWWFFFKDLCISTVETGFFPFFLHKLGHWNCIRSPKSYSSSFFRQHWRMKSFAVCDSCYFFWGAIYHNKLCIFTHANPRKYSERCHFGGSEPTEPKL